MFTEPKKNDEIKDEELDVLAGGAGKDSVDEQTDPPGDPGLSKGRMHRI